MKGKGVNRGRGTTEGVAIVCITRYDELDFEAEIQSVKAHEKRSELLDKDPVLTEMVRRLVDEFHPHKIFLFGSRAIGNAREDSDYDLLVVMSEPLDSARRLVGQAYEILGGLDVAKDIIFTHKEKFERRKTVMNTIAEIATTDGIELYAA